MQDIVQWDYGSWPDGLPKKGGANALSGAGSLDTATTCLSKTSRTKNFIIEYQTLHLSLQPDESGGVERALHGVHYLALCIHSVVVLFNVFKKFKRSKNSL
jgi:hypothetical protein